MKDIFIAIPAKNEESELGKCIRSIYYSSKCLQNKYKINTFICLNGCSDNTGDVADECKNKFQNLNIEILKSKEGKLYAQKNIIERIKGKKGYIFFIDADTTISKNSLSIIINELNKHKQLIAVGGFPIARKYKGLNPWKIVLDRILNVRSRHPMAEKSQLDVEEYHKLALKDPQFKNTSQKHELKSKIFFHGRLFALRSTKYWKMPGLRRGVVGDDSFLPDHIIYNFGKNRIRIRYDAVVYYNPFTSLFKHYKTYKRIYFDLKNLKKNYPKFKGIREHSVLVLDSEYIQSQSFTTRLKFNAFKIIRKCEKFIFELYPENKPSKIWKSLKR